MKKIVRTLCLVAMVALVATSCKKKEENANVTVAFEETKGFEAGPSLDGSKAWIDVNHNSVFKWNEGDKIAYYNLSKDNYEASRCHVLTAVKGSEGKTKTQFTGEVGAMLDGYFVFYQPDKAAGAQSGHTQGVGNREVFTVPATQTYNPNYMIDPKALVMACQSPEVGVFTLRHIFGFLNIGIAHRNGYPNSQVEYIKVTDTRHITGELELKLDEVNPETFSSLISQLEQVGENDPDYQQALGDYLHVLGYNAHQNTLGNEITLQCNNVNLVENGYRYFFIPLRPGALYKGFTITIGYKDGKIMRQSFEGMSYLIKPGTFTNIYAVSNGNWYINNQWTPGYYNW